MRLVVEELVLAMVQCAPEDCQQTSYQAEMVNGEAATLNQHHSRYLLLNQSWKGYL